MKTKNSVQIATALFVALLFCGLGGAQQTTFNYMPGTNFSQFHSFNGSQFPAAYTPIRSWTRKSITASRRS